MHELQVGISQQWYDELDNLAKEIVNPELAEEEEEKEEDVSEVESGDDGRIRIDCSVNTSPGSSEVTPRIFSQVSNTVV